MFEKFKRFIEVNKAPFWDLRKKDRYSGGDVRVSNFMDDDAGDDVMGASLAKLEAILDGEQLRPGIVYQLIAKRQPQAKADTASVCTHTVPTGDGSVPDAQKTALAGLGDLGGVMPLLGFLQSGMDRSEDQRAQLRMYEDQIRREAWDVREQIARERQALQEEKSRLEAEKEIHKREIQQFEKEMKPLRDKYEDRKGTMTESFSEAFEKFGLGMLKEWGADKDGGNDLAGLPDTDYGRKLEAFGVWLDENLKEEKDIDLIWTLARTYHDKKTNNGLQTEQAED